MPRSSSLQDRRPARVRGAAPVPCYSLPVNRPSGPAAETRCASPNVLRWSHGSDDDAPPDPLALEFALGTGRIRALAAPSRDARRPRRHRLPVPDGVGDRSDTVSRHVRPRHRRHAPESRPGRLADLATHPRRVGVQPARPDRPRQRGRSAHGVVPRPRARPPGGHAAGLRRRPLHAAGERCHRGHRRGDRRPDLAAPPEPARRRLRLRRRQRPQQPEHRHLRPVHHQHQRRQLRVRPRCRDRRDRLGDADLRLPGDTGGAQLGPHHRRRPGRLGPELPAPAGAPRRASSSPTTP